MERQEMIRKIHRDMLIELDSKFDKSTGSWAYDILRPPSSEMIDINRRIIEVDKKRSIFNLKGDELDIFISQFTPVRRRLDTAATTTLKITGRPGKVVKKGTLAGSVSHNYKTVESKTIGDSGEILVEAGCTEVGSGGNTEIGEITMFPITESGLESVTNITPAEGGYNEEEDHVLRKRYFDYIKTPATSGNVYHYKLWTGEVDGVGSVKIHPLWNGDNTIKLIVIDSNGQPAGEDLIERLQEHIDPKGEKLSDGSYSKWGCGYGKAPVGAFCTIVPANAIPISIAAEIFLEPETDLQQAIEEFRNKMIEGFGLFALDETQNTISVAKVGAMILNIPGVIDYRASTLTINGQKDSIIIGDEDVAVFDEVVFDEVIY